jgi:hypothetical protein
MQVNSNNYKQLTFFALLLVGISSLTAYLLLDYFGDAFNKLPKILQIIISIPTVPGIYALLFVLFDKWLWKWKIFKWIGIVTADDLNGKWVGTLKSSWDNFQSDIPSELLIKQTGTSIKVCGKFNQSRSVSLHEYFGKNEMYDQTALYYFYKNDPNYDAPQTMAMHEGSTILVYNREDGTLSGYYYSGRDRNNHGTMNFTRA